MKIIFLNLIAAMALPNKCLGLASLNPASPTAKLQPQGSLFEFDYENNDELPWMETGYNVWKWKGEHDINYIVHMAGILSSLGERYPDLAIDVNVYRYVEKCF